MSLAMDALVEPEPKLNSRGPRATAELPLVIVDASNVAFGLEGRGRRAHFKLLAHVMARIPPAGCEMKVIADASLRHRMDDRLAYEECVRAGLIFQAPAGRAADHFIRQLTELRKARGQRVVVITNDLFRQFPEFRVDRIAFLALSEDEVLFDPTLQEIQGGSPSNLSESSPSHTPGRNEGALAQ